MNKDYTGVTETIKTILTLLLGIIATFMTSLAFVIRKD